MRYIEAMIHIQSAIMTLQGARELEEERSTENAERALELVRGGQKLLKYAVTCLTDQNEEDGGPFDD